MNVGLLKNRAGKYSYRCDVTRIFLVCQSIIPLNKFKSRRDTQQPPSRLIMSNLMPVAWAAASAMIRVCLVAAVGALLTRAGILDGTARKTMAEVPACPVLVSLFRLL